MFNIELVTSTLHFFLFLKFENYLSRLLKKISFLAYWNFVLFLWKAILFFMKKVQKSCSLFAFFQGCHVCCVVVYFWALEFFLFKRLKTSESSSPILTQTTKYKNRKLTTFVVIVLKRELLNSIRFWWGQEEKGLLSKLDIVWSISGQYWNFILQ